MCVPNPKHEVSTRTPCSSDLHVGTLRYAAGAEISVVEDMWYNSLEIVRISAFDCLDCSIPTVIDVGVRTLYEYTLSNWCFKRIIVHARQFFRSRFRRCLSNQNELELDTATAVTAAASFVDNRRVFFMTIMQNYPRKLVRNGPEWHRRKAQNMVTNIATGIHFILTCQP